MFRDIAAASFFEMQTVIVAEYFHRTASMNGVCLFPREVLFVRGGSDQMTRGISCISAAFSTAQNL